SRKCNIGCSLLVQRERVLELPVRRKDLTDIHQVARRLAGIAHESRRFEGYIVVFVFANESPKRRNIIEAPRDLKASLARTELLENLEADIRVGFAGYLRFQLLRKTPGQDR